MDNAIGVSIEDMLVEDLTTELQDEPTFNLKILKSKVRNAIRDVVQARKYYNTNYSDSKIQNELYSRYYSQLYNIALYDYNKAGAEGETSHSENGTDRTYAERDKLFSGITPLSQVI